MLEVAIGYLARGWPPLALCSRECEVHFGIPCESPGKVPLRTWKHLQQGKVKLKEYDVRRQWRDYPSANVGIVLGLGSGLVAVDVDGNEQGMALLDARSGGRVETPLIFTTARGIRLLYAYDARIGNCSVEEGDGRMEVLTTGRQTVAPPSLHPTGHVYTWLGDWKKTTAPPCPSWLIGLSAERTKKGGEYPARGEMIENGQRNETLFRMACAMRRWGMDRTEILTVLDLANGRCVPPLEDKEIVALATKVEARYQPLRR